MAELSERRSASRIYLDHQATTPMDPHVIDIMIETMRTIPGNPNSVEHHAGRQALAAIDYARGQVARLVGCENEDVHFTSGASDAIRKALSLAVRSGLRKVAAMPVEHPAMISELFRLARDGHVELTWLRVDVHAQLDLASLHDVLNSGVDLICLMMANNEVGTIYPVKEVVRACREKGASLIVDATQAAGRLDLEELGSAFDYLILSAHKIYGPKGIGALIAPGQGSQATRSLGHAATPDVAGIAGFGLAAELARMQCVQDYALTSSLRDRLQAGLIARLPSIVVNGDLDHRLPNSLHISIPGIANDAILARVGDRLAISTGAACSSGAQEPSHVLSAMGLPEGLVDGALRISAGRFTTTSEIDLAVDIIAEAVFEIDKIAQERIAC